MIKTLSLIVGAALFGMFCFIFISLLFAVPTWLLWNWLMPVIFKLPEIGILQAWGLMVLCSILFKTSVTTKKEN